MNLSKLNLLREIEQKYDMWVDDYNLTPQDTEWLIEQAERAQKNAQDLEDMDRQLYSEQQQNKRYREALKNIYELAEYDEYDNTLEQIVSEVEKALEESE